MMNNPLLQARLMRLTESVDELAAAIIDGDIDNARIMAAAIREKRETCKNCGVLVTGHIADAGLVIEYAGYKFCSEICLNNWVDERGE
jgi:hypothetical protein